MWPQPDCGVLIGLGQIALWRGITEGAARVAFERGEIITFKRRGRNCRFALKSAQNDFWRRQGEKHLAIAETSCD
jgi:hypothetical protein